MGCRRPNDTETLLREVQTYAIPFLERYESLSRLLELLLAEDPGKWFFVTRNWRVELVIAILAVLGRREEALVWTDREIEARRNRPIGHRLELLKLKDRLERALGSGNL